jgi:hypothetical protein
MSILKKPKKPKRKLPGNIRFKSAFLASIEKEIREMFTEIFYDYIERFGLEIPKEKVRVSVAGTEGAKEDQPRQLAVTINTESGDILIDIRDPSLDLGDTSHIYIHYLFVECLAHEFIHVMQMLTKKTAYPALTAKFDSEDPSEVYYFSPDEVEAHTLAPFYGSRFGSALRDRCTG